MIYLLGFLSRSTKKNWSAYKR